MIRSNEVEEPRRTEEAIVCETLFMCCQLISISSVYILRFDDFAITSPHFMQHVGSLVRRPESRNLVQLLYIFSCRD